MAINKLFVHCSATKPSMDIGAAEIRQWHLNRGWSDIGYHYVIKRDGTVENGRPEGVTGAHVKGYNTGSLGICMVGGVDENNAPDANFTFAQYISLKNLLLDCMQRHNLGKASIHGHRDVSSKSCPSFDIHGFIETL